MKKGQELRETMHLYGFKLKLQIFEVSKLQLLGKTQGFGSKFF